MPATTSRQKRPKPETAVLSIIQCAQQLGIGKTAAYEAARRGEIPTLRFGKRIVVPKAAFERYLATAGERAA